MTPTEQFKFRLFVAGNTPNSAQAMGNLSWLCETHLRGRHEIEVVDVFREPGRALAEGIFMTPTLLKLSPGPTVKVVGTLSQPRTILLALGLEALAA
jgi:circadian clock protein KaiB